VKASFATKLAAALLVAVAAVAAAYHIPRKESPVSTPQLAPMHTFCIGRYLIDLPSDFQETPASDVELIYGLDKNWKSVKVELPRIDGSTPAFHAIVSKRLAELGSGYHLLSPDHSMIALTKSLDEDTRLIRAYDSPDMLDAFVSQIYRQTGEAVASYSARAGLGRDPAEVEARLLKVANGARFVADPEHAGKGTCFGRLAIDGGQDGEWLNVTLASRTMPDVEVSISINSTIREFDGGLLARVDKNKTAAAAAGANVSDIHTLRQGRTQIAGRPTEESLNWMLEGERQDKKSLSFTAETSPSPSTIEAPQVSITLGTGGQLRSGEYVNSSLADNDALNLWAAIIKSIRLRPGAL
jgi:hypothetical protein